MISDTPPTDSFRCRLRRAIQTFTWPIIILALLPVIIVLVEIAINGR